VTPAHRLPVLDGLRAISILLVLAAHMLPLGPKILKLNDSAGGMGMSLFFALSGFLIASTLLRNDDIPEFLVRRFARIVPAAYLYAVIVFTFIQFNPDAMLWTMSFVLNYFPQHFVDGYNSHFWSLCVEMQFYIAIALVVLFGGKKAIWIVWPTCFLVTLMRVADGAAYYHIQTHLRVDEILAGACVATLYRPEWKGSSARASTILIVIAALLWYLSAGPYTGWLQYLRPYATAAVLVATLCSTETLLTKILESGPMRYIAAISYALYIVHPVTFQGWFNEGSVLERYLLKRPISFAMTFAAAHLSTFYWERYWTQTARNWVAKKRSRQQQAL
jgi:peptidoglycan/LPS O-acetylase OafA/YrhL